MYKDPAETMSFFETFRPLVKESGHCEIVICPSFLELGSAVTATRGTSIQVGAQNLHWAKEGAFTGEVSAARIRASGCSHVIIGHSERREYFGETNESALKKTVAALDAGLIPIVCVGEREKNDAEAVLTEQFRCSLGAPEDAANAHSFIRALANGRFGAEAAANVRILYGGSVKSENAKGLRAQPEIDGFLVGGASLDPVSFASIVNAR